MWMFQGGGRWKIWQNAGTKIDADFGKWRFAGGSAGDGRGIHSSGFTTNDFWQNGKCGELGILS